MHSSMLLSHHCRFEIRKYYALLYRFYPEIANIYAPQNITPIGLKPERGYVLFVICYSFNGGIR